MDRKEIQLKKCFYITPIGEKKSTQFEKLEGLEHNVLKPVLDQQGYELEIAHTIDSPGSISDQIFERIVNSELVIVNLTGLNPNVMYELAVRHSFGKPCVIICEASTKLPFDLLVERTIFYDDTIKGSGELRHELTKKIISSNKNETDNPVTRAVSKAQILENNSDDPLKIILSEIDTLGRRMEKYENESNIKPYTFEGFLKVYANLSDIEGKANLNDVAEVMNISEPYATRMYETSKKIGLL